VRNPGDNKKEEVKFKIKCNMKPGASADGILTPRWKRCLGKLLGEQRSLPLTENA